MMTRDQNLQVLWVAKGRYPLTISPNTVNVTEYREAGAPLVYVPAKEGTYLSSGGTTMVSLNKAPHPNATRVFTNWLLTREGQIHMQKVTKLPSRRVDIPTEGIYPERLIKRDGKYFYGATDNEKWILNEREEYLKIVKEIFAPLLK